MTLQDKLKDIAKPKLLVGADGKAWTDGKATTIADFWDSFVENRLPEKNVVIEWFQLLNKYVQENDAVFAIRIFADRKAKDPKNLRRGFYNKTNQGFNFFYTDNYFTAYYAKMAIDGFVPTFAEYKDLMLSRDFPARFGPYCGVERTKAAYSINGEKGRNPGFSTNNYKIAHIINAGTDFAYKSQTQGIADICKKYCSRGDYNDWIWDSTEGCYCRPLQYNNTDAHELKALLVAHFLRFVCPMNYFLIPQKKCQSFNQPIPKNDIGEHPDLQRYAIFRFYEKYGDDYVKYLKKIMLPSSILNPIDNTEIQKLSALGHTLIDFSYSHNYKSKPSLGTKTKISKTSLPHKPSSPIHPFKNHLTTVTNRNGVPFSQNVINYYCSALKHQLFKNILTSHGLSTDIYQCTDITVLKAVYDEVSQKKSTDAQQLAKKRHGACKSALREYAAYLRVSKQATNDKGQVFL